MATKPQNYTKVPAPIGCVHGSDGYATHVANKGRGGFHVVKTLRKRNHITRDRRVVGMHCEVLETGLEYKLIADNGERVLTDDCWEVVQGGDSQKRMYIITGISDLVPGPSAYEMPVADDMELTEMKLSYPSKAEISTNIIAKVEVFSSATSTWMDTGLSVTINKANIMKEGSATLSEPYMVYAGDRVRLNFLAVEQDALNVVAILFFDKL